MSSEHTTNSMRQLKRMFDSKKPSTYKKLMIKPSLTLSKCYHIVKSCILTVNYVNLKRKFRFMNLLHRESKFRCKFKIFTNENYLHVGECLRIWSSSKLLIPKLYLSKNSFCLFIQLSSINLLCFTNILNSKLSARVRKKVWTTHIPSLCSSCEHLIK